MTVDVKRVDEGVVRRETFVADKVEETPTFLKITGEGSSLLIPLKDILGVVIHET